MFRLCGAYSIALSAFLGHASTAETWIPVNDQGNLLREQGHCRQAIPVLTKARSAAIKELGPAHLSVAVPANNLAAAYLCLGEFTRAERHFREALAILEGDTGDPRRPGVLNNLGLLLLGLSRSAEAEQLLQQALALSETVLGPNHRNTGIAAISLGVLRLNQGEFAQARDLFGRSLAIFEISLGPDHVDTATALNNLGTVYLYLGEYQRAKELTAQALELRRRLLPPAHPEIAQSLYNHAVSLKKLGQGQAARTEFRKAALIRNAHAYENFLGVTVDVRVLETK